MIVYVYSSVIVMLCSVVARSRVIEPATIYEANDSLEKASIFITKSGSVITAAPNTLVQINHSNNLVASLDTSCMYLDCQNTSTKNYVSIFTGFLYNGKEYVLFCGTNENQSCSILSAENILEHYELYGTHYFLKKRINKNSVNIQMISQETFIVAQNVTRATNNSYTFFKCSITNKNNCWNISHNLFHKTIIANKAETFEFIYSFTDPDNAYFLRNNHSGSPKAYLSQLCKDSYKLHSFAELEIRCGSYVTAKAAYYYKTTNVEALVVIFCKEQQTTVTCSLCLYRLTMIRASFEQAKTQCFHEMIGSWPSWIYPDYMFAKSCTEEIKSTDFLCGDLYSRNLRILGKEILSRPSLADVDLISSIVMDSGKNKHRVFISSQNSIDVFLVSGDMTVVKHLKTIFSSDEPVNNMVLDTNADYLYFTHGKKVAYLKTDDCSIHEYCTECLSDVNECRWILGATADGGACLSKLEADTMNTSLYWFSDFCPVRITQYNSSKTISKKTCSEDLNKQFDTHENKYRGCMISPLTGPRKGGTEFTLMTDLRTSQLQVSALPETLLVHIGPYCICNISRPVKSTWATASGTSFGFKFNCVTCPSNTSSSNVTLVINDADRNDEGLIVPFYGNFTYQHLFVFKIPIVNQNVKTQFVRQLGRVKISLEGSDLDIGTICNVHVGTLKLRCEGILNNGINQLPIMKRNNTFVRYTAPAQNTTGEFPVKLEIDNALLTAPNVTYVENPVIDVVWPSKTIKSGGINITVNGTNFNGLGQHVFLGLMDYNNKSVVYWRCVNEENKHGKEETVVCITSSLGAEEFPRLILLLPSDDVTMDDVTEYLQQNKTLEILPDPEFIKHLPILYITNDFQEFNFTGRMLTNVLQNEINIMFDTMECELIKMEDELITCSLNTSNIEQHKHVIKIEATIGLNIVKELGHATFDKYKKDFIDESRDHSDTSSSYSYTTILLVFIVAVTVIIIVVMAVRYVTRKRRRNRVDYRVSYRNGGNIVLDALSSTHNTDVDQNARNIYQEQTFTKSPNEDGASRESAPLLLDETTQVLLERQNLLIDRNSLVMAEVIGQGHFGCVYKCFYRLPNSKEEILVAAKTLHRDQPKEMNVKMFLKEALIMKDFHHNHVMKLIGICLGMDQLPLVVLPYMKCGDLLTYLRDEKNAPKVSDLVMFGIDIANGMHYLSELKFVHRDLAARNCMLSDDLTVKIADFGLSRDVYEKEYYSSCDRTTKLPIKWMSPESLEFRVFSSKSDVWSYGVVLWELLTRGMTPYPTVDNWEVIRYLKEGHRMGKPDHCPSKVYKIMLRCWNWDPEARPTFGSLTIEMPEILGN